MEQLLVSDGTDNATLTKKNVGETEKRNDTWLLELKIHESNEERSRRMLEAAAHTVSISGGGNIEYWIENISEEDNAVPVAAGYSPFRDLRVLSRGLPALPAEIETRGFTKSDPDEIIRINNAAFDWHPEQSGMTIESLTETQSEAWYADEDFRILETNNELRGFCWMKIHVPTNSTLKKGEIYVIAVDPSFQGQGLGRQLALSGLEWLSKKKIREVFLYVESDNYPALKTYDSLGFEHISTNRCFHESLVQEAKYHFVFQSPRRSFLSKLHYQFRRKQVIVPLLRMLLERMKDDTV